jgi:hypothetical protein
MMEGGGTPAFSPQQQQQQDFIHFPKMRLLSSLTVTILTLLCGGNASGSANAGAGAGAGGVSKLDAFVAKERPFALQGALDNIGPDGVKARGAGAGFVVASPSMVNPDC